MRQVPSRFHPRIDPGSDQFPGCLVDKNEVPADEVESHDSPSCTFVGNLAKALLKNTETRDGTLHL